MERDHCYTGTGEVIINSVDIGFIHGDIHITMGGRVRDVISDTIFCRQNQNQND